MPQLYLVRRECPKCKSIAFVIDKEINCGCGVHVDSCEDPLEELYKENKKKLDLGIKIKKKEIVYLRYCKDCKRRFFTFNKIIIYCDDGCREKYWQVNNERSYRICLFCKSKFKIKREKQFCCSKGCELKLKIKKIEELIDDYHKLIPKVSIKFINSQTMNKNNLTPAPNYAIINLSQ